MKVSRLEIFGFKSFTDRLLLPLESGITGVVGPNGCGKSNIVDATRWVLGESKASTLRGGALEDVIFSGTDKLRPLGLAEVTITLRASEEGFLNELVSPALEAELLEKEVLAVEEAIEGGEEGSTEGLPPEVANSDVRPHLTVIEGNLGKEEPDSVAADTPKESDEARPEQPKSGETSLASRYAWLKSVAEVQITRRLYRSGESEFFINRVPCRLRDIKDLFRALGLGARTYTIVAQGEVSRIITAKPEERRLILEEAAGVLGLRDRIGAARRRLEETSTNLTRLNDVIKEVERQVGSLKRQAARARNRQALKDEIAALEQTIAIDSLKNLEISCQENTDLEKGLEVKEEGLKASSQRVQAEEQAARDILIALDLEGDDLRRKVDAAREQLTNYARERGEMEARINELRAFVVAAQGERANIEERDRALSEREEGCAKDVAALKETERALRAEITQHTGLGRAAEEELARTAAKLQTLREEQSKCEKGLRTLRERSISVEAGLKALREQLFEASPQSQIKRTLGAAWEDGIDRIKDADILVNGLNVPRELATAVQVVLAGRAEFIVAKDHLDLARTIVSKLQEKEGWALGIFRSGGSNKSESDSQRIGSGLSRLIDYIEVRPGFECAAQRVFSSVYYAESLELAAAFLEENKGASGIEAVTVVTKDGDLLTADSYYAIRHEGGLVRLKHRIEESETLLRELNAEHLTLTQTKSALEQDAAIAQGQNAEALRRLNEAKARINEFNNKLGNIAGRLQVESRLLSQVHADRAALKGQLQSLLSKVERFQVEEQSVQQALRSADSGEEESLRGEILAWNERLSLLDGERRSGRERLSELAKGVMSARNELDRVRAEIGGLKLDIQKLRLERENVRERVIAEYGGTLWEKIELDSKVPELPALTDDQKAEKREAIQKLRDRILREGEVDPLSIERAAEESQRLEELEHQRDDLDKAQHTINRTIERLSEVSKNRFLATFKAVNENFSRLIPRLFGGGKGSIELMDVNNPLESGIEIVARPPGKKLNSIELLSGGEKALCATALIFAMFLERPSPLCVLDEVDAPLDEANVVRFLSLIKEMSSRTQFIMITHNKQSMSVCDNLVGVTMQEPGASKVITVSLQEAYSQVA